MKAAIDEAQSVGLKTTGHLCAVTFREAADLGIADLAHGAFTASDFVPTRKRKVPAQLIQAGYPGQGEGPVATSLKT